MNWLMRLFRPQSSSADIAKGRLKLVLSYDRTNLTPELLELLQNDIVRVISQHIEIDRAGMTVTAHRGDAGGGDHLVADIPIISTRPTPKTAEQAPTTAPAQTRPAGYQSKGGKKRKHKHRQYAGD